MGPGSQASGLLRLKRGASRPAESEAEPAQTTKAIVRVGACPGTECPRLRDGWGPEAFPSYMPDPPLALFLLQPRLEHSIDSSTLRSPLLLCGLQPRCIPSFLKFSRCEPQTRCEDPHPQSEPIPCLYPFRPPPPGVESWPDVTSSGVTLIASSAESSFSNSFMCPVHQPFSSPTDVPCRCPHGHPCLLSR